MAEFQGELVRVLTGTLKEHSARRGGRTAYADGRRAVTYRELEERTGRLAGHLARLGVRRGERVAIHLGNRVELVESCLGVLRAGAMSGGSLGVVACWVVTSRKAADAVGGPPTHP
ncbi:AMP-binding protein [Streptomyces mirabilis]|uniref:AMP-binding protein n=1 Tax=Streptomyces mirabilis TaxID=68239 RepID=UPI000765D851|nr:AMP-binding protein [Streptomyces mirabilis]